MNRQLWHQCVLLVRGLKLEMVFSSVNVLVVGVSVVVGLAIGIGPLPSSNWLAKLFDAIAICTIRNSTID